MRHGKTLVALWVAERLQSQTILVLLPSLALLRQTLHEWLHETSLPSLAYLCVCSDPTVKQDLDAIATPQSGYTAGNNFILQLVTDGMNLCPPNPNFIQARDAILEADLVANCAADWADLWAAFAKRGLGWYATAPDSWTTSGVEESFVPAPMTGSPCEE